MCQVRLPARAASQQRGRRMRLDRSLSVFEQPGIRYVSRLILGRSNAPASGPRHPEVDRALSARQQTGILAQSRNQFGWIGRTVTCSVRGRGALTDCGGGVRQTLAPTVRMCRCDFSRSYRRTT